MEGFISESCARSRRHPISLIPKCGSCGLHRTCQSPKMKPSGNGRKRVLIVGEAPGREEDQKGKQFIGKSGRFLEQEFSRLGWDMRRDCVLTNAIICRPPNNKTPDEKKIGYCLPNLLRTIEEVNPDVIIPFGAVAVKAVVGSVWKDDIGPIKKWVGWHIPCVKPNAWICPNWHPAHILYDEKNEVLLSSFRRTLRKALSIKGKPWETLPDYKRQVNVVYSVKEAADLIRNLHRRGRPLAFDYETNMLKPDSKNARIVCCAMSDGEVSIAYPWDGEAIIATREVLLSDTPKVGYNLKFEDRWTRKVFGRGVRNWVHDGMLAAHLIDNRRGITGLKFQAFVHLGAEDYDSHLKPMLMTEGGNVENKIRNVNLQDLLLYCGLDALLEHKMYQIQRKRIK